MGPVVRELQAKGVDVRVLHPLNRDGNTPLGAVESLTHGMGWLAERFDEDRPDVVLLLGDRYETLGAAQVARLFKIPVAHIHGGETTEGALDDEFRHAITQLASIHFVSAEKHADQVAWLRESIDNIHVVGAPGLDNIVDLPPQEFQQPYFLVTYHPATKSDKQGHIAILQALNSFPDHGIVWTGVNNDPGRDEIQSAFYGAGNVIVATQMTPKRYLSAMKYAACCIGNSSSFLIEAPALGVPTVNVGDRQKGRLRGPSVIDADENADAISTAIKWAMADRCVAVMPYPNPYGPPGASKRIAEILTA